MNIEAFLSITGVATPDEQAQGAVKAAAAVQDAVRRLNHLMAEANSLGLRVEIEVKSHDVTTFGCRERRTINTVNAQILKYMG